MAAKDSRLQAHDISVTYGSYPVLKELNFDVLEGELTVILGPNACGKSTLLKTLARVLNPQTGQVKLDGRVLKDIKSKEIAQTLAMLPQAPEVPAGASVADIVARGRYPHQNFFQTWSQEDQEICQEAMRAAHVEDLADRNIEALSGGQRQRVWIAMTLAQQTPLILLDEPTTYLDITHQIEVLNLTKKLHQQGRTLVLVLHDLNLAFRYATHLVLMREGRIVAQGSPRAIVTADLMKQVYQLDCQIIQDPASGAPLVVPAC